MGGQIKQSMFFSHNFDVLVTALHELPIDLCPQFVAEPGSIAPAQTLSIKLSASMHTGRFTVLS